MFLVGPPGSGKSALGQRVCAELRLRFVDLVDDGGTDAALQELVRARGADVVTLPWAPARDARWLDLCRRSGETVALWAHPLDMQARSGHSESLFTPVKRLKTRGGFGRNGTGCREYRHLSGIRGDLDAAGFLVMCCDAPKGKDVLDSFGRGPSEYEFRRRMSDSPNALARFRFTWDAFGRFLRDSGMLDDGGGKLR